LYKQHFTALDKCPLLILPKNKAKQWNQILLTTCH